MSKILTQEEIDALLKNVSVGESFDPSVEAKERSVHLYDFKHPDRISKDQLRALRTIHDAFARAFGTYLSTTLRTMVDVNLLSIDQATYSEYMLSLSVPACIHIVAARELKGSSILEFSPQFALTVVDRLLGGTGARVGTDRELTVIEQNILRKVVDEALVHLADAWRHAATMNYYVESYESNPQFVQIASASEIAAIISFEISIRDMTYPMNICAPYFVLESLIQNLSTGFTNVGVKRVGSTERKMLHARVGLTRLPIVALLGTSTISLEELITIRKGDCIRLLERADECLKLRIGGRVKFWGEPGASGPNKAVKIVRRVTDTEEIHFE